MVGNALHDQSGILQAELAKGLGFILVSGVGLFFLSRYLMARIAQQSAEIERQRHSIQILDRRAASGLLASAIGHDANNLLAAVGLSLELIKRGVSPEREQQIIDSLGKVVDELMILNKRLVAGGQADQPGELKVLDLKHEAERVLQFIEEGHPVSELNITFTNGGDVKAPINRHLYFQVILNLLSNCARHAGPKARVHVHTEDLKESVKVIVEDNGPGVPENDREKIFTPYYSNHPEGAGLGLTSVRAIINMHSGEITCSTSEELGGAKFVMEFPRVQTRDTQPAAMATA